MEVLFMRIMFRMLNDTVWLSLMINGKALTIEEKPIQTQNQIMQCQVYIFMITSVVAIAANMKPSDRGELEITDVNNEYLNLGKVEC